jgi:membrane fusion protein
MNDLFRTQAVEHHKHRLHGDVLLVPSISHTILVVLLLTWICIVFIWLFNSSYARKETVLGWLEPPSGIVRIYPEDSGIIKTVLVNEGEQVVQDQPLVIISGDRILANGEHLESQLLQEYESQQQFLNEQLRRTETIYTTRTKDIKQQITAAQHKLDMLNQQLATLNQHYELIEKQAARYKTLREAGHVSNVEYDNAIVQELALRSEKQELIRDQIEQRNLIEQLKTQQQLLPDESANQIDQLRERLSNIAQQIAQLSGQRSHIIKAPRDGIINNLQAIEGQQAQTGNQIPLLTLMPSDTQLTAQLLIPVRSIGFVEPDQILDIRYDAFPYQKFGLYTGQIIYVSKTLLLPNELLNAPVAIQEPVYRVTALLKQPNVHAYGKEFPLKPGMTLSADVRLSERTLVQWLLEPIYSLQGRL